MSALQQEANRVEVETKASAGKLKLRCRVLLNYLEMEIPVGATLLYQDGEITCTVLDRWYVQLQKNAVNCIQSTLAAGRSYPRHRVFDDYRSRFS